jgi:hypothetical protein
MQPLEGGTLVGVGSEDGEHEQLVDNDSLEDATEPQVAAWDRRESGDRGQNKDGVGHAHVEAPGADPLQGEHAWKGRNRKEPGIDERNPGDGEKQTDGKRVSGPADGHPPQFDGRDTEQGDESRSVGSWTAT